MSEPTKRRGMSGKDVITVGIFSAIYFVINFAFMLLGGLHPLLWILMPGFIALFTGIPYLMMCAKVQKVGSVLLMGLITGLIYYVTGQFTIVILVTFVLACGLAELTRGITLYHSMAGNLVSFVLFSVGMVGSPLPIWLMREDFPAADHGAGDAGGLCEYSGSPLLHWNASGAVPGAYRGRDHRGLHRPGHVPQAL